MKSIIIAIFIITCTTSFAQNDTITVTFVGKQYKNLTLHLDKYRYQGMTNDNKTWCFVFPDSAYQQQSAMGIIAEDSDTLKHFVAINAKGENTVRMGHYGLIKNTNYTLCYSKSVSDTTIVYTRIFDAFILDDYFDDFDLWMRWIRYNQTDAVDKQKQWIKKNNNSHYAMAMLGGTLDRYKSPFDVKRLYDLFSDQQKNSYYGLIVKDYLDRSLKKIILKIVKQ